MSDTTTPINPFDPGLVGAAIVCTYGNGERIHGSIAGAEMAGDHKGDLIPFLLADFGGDALGRIPIYDGALPAHMTVPMLTEATDFGFDVTRPTADAVYINIVGVTTYPVKDHHLVIHYNGMPVWDSDQS